MAFPDSRMGLLAVEKVAAHQKERAGETEGDRWCRLANDWADTMAKRAAAIHAVPDREHAKLDAQAFADAVTACVVLAKATILWPAAAAMRDGQRRPTTRAERIAAAVARTSVRRAAAAARRQDEAVELQRRHATHNWVDVGGSKRCSNCLVAST